MISSNAAWITTILEMSVHTASSHALDGSAIYGRKENPTAVRLSATDFADVHTILDTPWQPRQQCELEDSLAPYMAHLYELMRSGVQLKTHIPEAFSIALPICETVDPESLFATLGDVDYESKEYESFWLTTHYPNPEPVVTLIPKQLPGQPEPLVRLCELLSESLECAVGGSDGAFLACLSAGFSWAMHTDDDNSYELVRRRIHVPLRTNPQNIMIWGGWDEAGKEIYVRSEHLERGFLHAVRVDIPHTVINRHFWQPRIHLIIDVKE